MRILVTGASGRIGAHIVQELTRAGYSVRAAIRPGSPRAAKLDVFPCERADAALLDAEELRRAVQGCEAVVHNSVIFTSDPAVMVAGSLSATATLLEAARQQHVKRFVFISSTSVYEGTAYRPGDPIREEEATPLITNVYGACKLGAEALCSAYEREHGLQTVAIRLPMVVAGAELLRRGFLLEDWEARAERGPAAWRGAVAEAQAAGDRIVVPLNHDGSPWQRHFCDVRDAARGVRLALEAVEAPGRAYNIASRPIRYDEAAALLESLAGWRSARIPFPEDYRYAFALDRAADFLGYAPEFDVRRMVQDAWAMAQGGTVPGLMAP